METKEIESIEGIELKRGSQISTFDNKSRLQYFKSIIPTSSTTTNKIFYYELDERYDFCTGISIQIGRATGTLPIKNTLSISDDYHNIFNSINLGFWHKNFSEINKDDLFMPCFFRAKNNRIKIQFTAETAIDTTSLYIIFRLENKKSFNKFEYNFVEKSYLNVAHNTGLINQDIVFDNSYEKIKGVQNAFFQGTDLSISSCPGSKTLSYQGSIVMNELTNNFIQTSQNKSYINSFFPLNFICQNKTISIARQYDTSIAVDQLDCILFLLEKPFDKKYL